MEHINAMGMRSSELNRHIQEALKKDGKATVENPHSMHNVGIGIQQPGKIQVKGSTGFYTGGFLEGPTLEVEGSAGWYAGDNMMSGELIIRKNTGCNAGTYLCGGTMVIYGSAGSRLGYGMKGGTIIVCGKSGRWTGQMTMGGTLVLLGQVGEQLGESMYKGVIFTRDAEAQAKLGGNVFIDAVSSDEQTRLDALFSRYGIDAKGEEFRAVRPLGSGRHTYVLFKPDLKPEYANRGVAP
jgi:methylamine---glutamate N-methyltransferase subunit B